MCARRLRDLHECLQRGEPRCPRLHGCHAGEDGVAASTPADVAREVPRNSSWQLGLCKYFVNTGQCSKGSQCKCARRVLSEIVPWDDLKAARAEWLLARKQRRQLVSWVEGNPHAFEAEKKGRRAAVLADWLVETFGKELLNSGSGVLDVAGGKGELSFELVHRYNIRSTLLEPRLWAPCKLSKRQKSLLRAARIPVSEFSIPQIQSTLQTDEGPHLEAVLGCSLLVGMHPDEATDPIMRAANKYSKPFCIVPCCVFAAQFPSRQYTNANDEQVPVQTYQELVSYLVEHGGARKAQLPFDGRNLLVFRM